MLQSQSCSSPFPGASKHIAGFFAHRTVPTDNFSGRRNSAAAPSLPLQGESFSLRPLCSTESSTPRHIPGWPKRANFTGPRVFSSCKPTTRCPWCLLGICLNKKVPPQRPSSRKADAIKVMRPALRQCRGSFPPVVSEMGCSKAGTTAAQSRGESDATGL